MIQTVNRIVCKLRVNEVSRHFEPINEKYVMTVSSTMLLIALQNSKLSVSGFYLCSNQSKDTIQ